MDEFPSLISIFLKNRDFTLITECSSSYNIIYDVNDEFILKGSMDHYKLGKEREINAFLRGKLPVSLNCMFVPNGRYCYYLKTKLKGEPLCSKRYLDNPELLIKLLADAVKMYHSVDTTNCKIYAFYSIGDTFVHGSLKLENILLHEDKISGFIDVGRGGIGDEWDDYAWSIRSLEEHLKTKEYTKKYLDLLGVEFDAKKYKYYTVTNLFND